MRLMHRAILMPFSYPGGSNRGSAVCGELLYEKGMNEREGEGVSKRGLEVEMDSNQETAYCCVIAEL